MFEEQTSMLNNEVQTLQEVIQNDQLWWWKEKADYMLELRLVQQRMNSFEQINLERQENMVWLSSSIKSVFEALEIESALQAQDE